MTRIKSCVEEFLTTDQEQQIVNAIRLAELKTSGEIRVHLEAQCNGDAYQRAQHVFYLLKMDNTRQLNGILLYIAVQDHKFAIVGDRGIDQVVGQSFWINISELLSKRFRESEFTTGIVDTIELIGKQLVTYFPRQQDDTNELPDQITTS